MSKMKTKEDVDLEAVIFDRIICHIDDARDLFDECRKDKLTGEFTSMLMNKAASNLDISSRFIVATREMKKIGRKNSIKGNDEKESIAPVEAISVLLDTYGDRSDSPEILKACEVVEEWIKIQAEKERKKK